MKNIYLGVFLLMFVILAGLVAVAPAQVDVGRKTTAITYPLDDTVNVPFKGTTQFPSMKGTAKVKRTGRSNTTIELSVDNMPRPFQLGPGYATYIVWAISPTGQADNLGEIKRSTLGFIDSKVKVTTPLQTFALIITAEPHFLVTRPSQKIMLENLYPVSPDGKRIATTPAVTYFGNSSDYFRDPRTPEIAESDYQKTPSAIFQARQAVALARFAGADRDASSELAEAETLMQNAQNAWLAGRDSDTVDIAARRSIEAAVRAENLAMQRKVAREKRNEQTRTDAEIRAAENKYTDAQTQISDLKEELARETRTRELAERDNQNFANQLKDLREDNGRLREELGRLRLEAENAKAKIAAAEADKMAADQRREDEVKAAETKAAETGLIASLKAYGTVAKTDRGIVLTLPESYWSGARSSTLLAAGAGKVSAIGELLANNPSYRITVESHTDNTGAPDLIQSLTDKRSYAIAEKFASLGVEEGRIVAKGLGASVAAAPNTTAANKAKNRRVQVILSPFTP